jgi:hypothetical protein
VQNRIDNFNSIKEGFKDPKLEKALTTHVFDKKAGKLEKTVE